MVGMLLALGLATTNGGCLVANSTTPATAGERLAEPPAAENPVYVLMETSLGKIKIELNPDKAPATVKNFLQYVDDKHYDGLIFHRVARNPAVIQGGGYEPGMKERRTRKPIKNESGNGLSNLKGTIAMARTRELDSATSQFYINAADNLYLDAKSKNDGYAVFGRVVEGMDVVKKIHEVEADNERPKKDVVILSVRRVEK